MKNNLDNYTGSKNGAGVWQKIISAMPEHKIFIELFAGSMAITRRKRPALETVGVEIDRATFQALETDSEIINAGANIKHDNALNFLDSAFLRQFAPKDVLIYADPPYLFETRRSTRPLYDHEFGTQAQHLDLLEKLMSLDCLVMLSGYRSALYDAVLKDWRSIDIPTSVRGGGSAIETVWMNYPEPLKLHDSRFIGKDFTDRQRIKRKAERQVKKLLNLPTFERQLIFEEIAKLEKQFYEKD